MKGTIAPEVATILRRIIGMAALVSSRCRPPGESSQRMLGIVNPLEKIVDDLLEGFGILLRPRRQVGELFPSGRFETFGAIHCIQRFRNRMTGAQIRERLRGSERAQAC